MTRKRKIERKDRPVRLETIQCSCGATIGKRRLRCPECNQPAPDACHLFSSEPNLGDTTRSMSDSLVRNASQDTGYDQRGGIPGYHGTPVPGMKYESQGRVWLQGRKKISSQQLKAPRTTDKQSPRAVPSLGSESQRWHRQESVPGPLVKSFELRSVTSPSPLRNSTHISEHTVRLVHDRPGVTTQDTAPARLKPAGLPLDGVMAAIDLRCCSRTANTDSDRCRWWKLVLIEWSPNSEAKEIHGTAIFFLQDRNCPCEDALRELTLVRDRARELGFLELPRQSNDPWWRYRYTKRPRRG